MVRKSFGGKKKLLTSPSSISLLLPYSWIILCKANKFLALRINDLLTNTSRILWSSLSSIDVTIIYFLRKF